MYASSRPCFALLVLLAGLSVAPVARSSGVLRDTPVAVATLEASNFPLRSAGVAFDGLHFWASLVGSGAANDLVRYDTDGSFIENLQTGVDSRSIFTDAQGRLYSTDSGIGGIQVRRYADGVPELLYTLSSTPDVQMEFALRISDNTLYGHKGGTITTYDFDTGQETGSFALSGYASERPADEQIAIVEDRFILTYTDTGLVEAWDFAGNKVGEVSIGDDSFDQQFSFAFAAGLVWIESAPDSTWTG